MTKTTPDVPQVPSWFQDGFHRFLRPFLKRHFHAVAVDRDSRGEAPPDEGSPLIVYANHPSWWDPLIAHFLHRELFPTRQFYAPIDAEALEQYRVFGKLGFYGVRMNSTRGAASFLKQSQAILADSANAIWITPEGRFCDTRDASAELMPGLAHLCKRAADGFAVPLALEYVFWDERLPVCLASVGRPVSICQHAELSKAELTELLTMRLRQTQKRLAELAIARSSEPFDNLIRGRAGAGTTYDIFRRVRSWSSGKRFRSRHGEQFE